MRLIRISQIEGLENSLLDLQDQLDNLVSYDAGTLAQLNTGTSTEPKVWSPKILSDWQNNNAYTLPIASATVLGGVRIPTQANGGDLVIDSATGDLKILDTIARVSWAEGLFFQKPNGTTAQYIRGDGSLATFVDTTYSLITQAAITAGTETTGRLINAKLLADNYFKKPTGTTAQYIRGDGSLATYSDTTYSVATDAELNSTTSTTGRLISGQRLNKWYNDKPIDVELHNPKDNLTLVANATSATITIGTGEPDPNINGIIIFINGVKLPKKRITGVSGKVITITNTVATGVYVIQTDDYVEVEYLIKG